MRRKFFACIAVGFAVLLQGLFLAVPVEAKSATGKGKASAAKSANIKKNKFVHVQNHATQNAKKKKK